MDDIQDTDLTPGEAEILAELEQKEQFDPYTSVDIYMEIG